MILYIIIILPWIAFFATSIWTIIPIKCEECGGRVVLDKSFILAGFLLPTVVLLLSSMFLYLLVSNRISERTAKFINKVFLTMAIIILLIVGLARLLSPFSYNPIIVVYPHMALTNNLGLEIEYTPEPCKCIVEVCNRFWSYFILPTEVVVYVHIPESHKVLAPEINICLLYTSPSPRD